MIREVQRVCTLEICHLVDGEGYAKGVEDPLPAVPEYS
jgi:hypothetical protein